MVRLLPLAIVYLLVGCASTTPVLPARLSSLVSAKGPPPIRFTVDARLATRLAPDARILDGLDEDVRDLVDRVEFVGWYASARTVERYSVINEVVVSRRTVEIPELSVAEPGELGREGRSVPVRAGMTSAAMVESFGTPASYRQDGDRELLQFDAGDDLLIAVATGQKVWSVFTLRISPDLETSYREDFATIIMDAFVRAGDGLDLGSSRKHVMHMLRAGER